MKTITSASYSRLLDFESCRLKAYLKHVERIPDPRPSTAADRGTDIHNRTELFVRGEGPIPPEAAKHYSDELVSLRKHFEDGNVSLEGEWGFDQDWKICDWKTGWFRVKADAVVRLNKKHAVVIDYKTGKRFGNEIKHGEQLQLYALSVLLREPKVERITAELWYFDQNELASYEVTQETGLHCLKGFDNRARKMTSATTFPPNPNGYSCKWCPYKPAELGGTGHCAVGV